MQKRAVEAALIHNPRATDEEVCCDVYEQHVPPLSSWKIKVGEEGFPGAYHGPDKDKVEKYISAIRREMGIRRRP